MTIKKISMRPNTRISTYTKLTKLAFKQRMTQEERIAIRQAANSSEPYAPAVYDFQDLLDSATYVDVTRQDTIDGVNQLETLGLLAEGRAEEILSTDITKEEAFKE